MSVDMDMDLDMDIDMVIFPLVSVCFEWSLGISVISKHRNKLFRY
jgi:hypothetical protein